MDAPRRNADGPKFDSPNYSNARGKAAFIANVDKNEHVNPDTNSGHLQEPSRTAKDEMPGGWDNTADRPLVVFPVDTDDSDKPVIEPHGIRRV
jgi:hypothetical protein